MTLLHPKKGFTLIELILVLAIAATLCTLSLMGYQRLRFAHNIEVTSRYAHSLLEGMEKYYLRNCNNMASRVTVETLKNGGYIDTNADVNNPLGWTFTFGTTETQPVKVWVSAQIPASLPVEYYARVLNGTIDPNDSRSIIWYKLPYTVQGFGVSLTGDASGTPCP